MSSHLSLHARWAALAASCACVLGAAAQSLSESDAPPPVPGQVLSDVAPMPAEERDSHGALVIDGAPVRAQQDQQRAKPVEPSRIGRNASALVERTRSWSDVEAADAQDDVPSGEASGAGPEPGPN